MTAWSILLWLVAAFVVMRSLKQWISRHIQGVALLLTGSTRMALWLFWLLFVPGTFLHELSHWLTAHMLGVRAHHFSVWLEAKPNGELQLGAVEIEQTDPLRHSLIGLAPFIFGSAAVLLISYTWLELEQLSHALTQHNLEAGGQALLNIASQPNLWLWLYLVFSISNGMLPSASDRKYWWVTLLTLALLAALVFGLDLGRYLFPPLERFGLLLVAHLLAVFTITIGVDLLFIVLIAIIETILGWLLRRQIQYNR
jgi:hypothetical protein